MIKNHYYLVAGILFILSSLTLAWRGLVSFLPDTNAAQFASASKTTIIYVWHIITVENLIFGVAFILMSVYKEVEKVKFTAWFVAIIMIARLAIILISTLVENKIGVANTITESIVILVFVGIIIFGTVKK